MLPLLTKQHPKSEVRLYRRDNLEGKEAESREQPDHRVAQALLTEHGAPLLATTLIPPGEDTPLNDPDEIRDRFEKVLQAVVDAGACPMEPTTIVDLTDDEPVLIRRGRGDPKTLGLPAQ